LTINHGHCQLAEANAKLPAQKFGYRQLLLWLDTCTCFVTSNIPLFGLWQGLVAGQNAFWNIPRSEANGVNNALWTEACKLARKRERNESWPEGKRAQAQPIFLAFAFEFFGFSRVIVTPARPVCPSCHFKRIAMKSKLSIAHAVRVRHSVFCFWSLGCWAASLLDSTGEHGAYTKLKCTQLKNWFSRS